MTPNQIEIMLWYHASGADHPQAAQIHGYWPEEFRNMVAVGMLEKCDPESGQRFQITERGRAYVGFLMAVPVPEPRWEIPLEFFRGGLPPECDFSLAQTTNKL
jgi:hypothetical protein